MKIHKKETNFQKKKELFFLTEYLHWKTQRTHLEKKNLIKKKSQSQLKKKQFLKKNKFLKKN